MHGLFETMPSPKAADLICLPLSVSPVQTAEDVQRGTA